MSNQFDDESFAESLKGCLHPAAEDMTRYFYEMRKIECGEQDDGQFVEIIKDHLEACIPCRGVFREIVVQIWTELEAKEIYREKNKSVRTPTETLIIPINEQYEGLKKGNGIYVPQKFAEFVTNKYINDSIAANWTVADNLKVLGVDCREMLFVVEQGTIELIFEREPENIRILLGNEGELPNAFWLPSLKRKSLSFIPTFLIGNLGALEARGLCFVSNVAGGDLRDLIDPGDGKPKLEINTLSAMASQDYWDHFPHEYPHLQMSPMLGRLPFQLSEFKEIINHPRHRITQEKDPEVYKGIHEASRKSGHLTEAYIPDFKLPANSSFDLRVIQLRGVSDAEYLDLDIESHEGTEYLIPLFGVLSGLYADKSLMSVSQRENRNTYKLIKHMPRAARRFIEVKEEKTLVAHNSENPHMFWGDEEDVYCIHFRIMKDEEEISESTQKTEKEKEPDLTLKNEL